MKKNNDDSLDHHFTSPERSSLKNITITNISETPQKKQKQLPEISIKINGGLIANIYGQLVKSFSDFYGVLLGHLKYLPSINTSSILIDNASFIFEKNLLNYPEKLAEFINTVNKKITDTKIVGLFSSKSFSFPKLSIKEMKFYSETKQILFSNQSLDYIPLTFGTFVHLIQKEKKVHEFQSTFWVFEESEKKFQKYPYHIINTSLIMYKPIRNPIPNMNMKGIINPRIFEEQIDKIEKCLHEALQTINNEYLNQIRDLKQKISKEENELQKTITVLSLK